MIRYISWLCRNIDSHNITYNDYKIIRKILMDKFNIGNQKSKRIFNKFLNKGEL
tara:strand:- start:1823 stop:1984 length:162 start_codon:yes stop_codon:yes gene_type:complete